MISLQSLLAAYAVGAAIGIGLLVIGWTYWRSRE